MQATSVLKLSEKKLYNRINNVFSMKAVEGEEETGV